MELKLPKNQKSEKTLYILKLAENCFHNTDAEVYARIRDFIRNHEYDFDNKTGLYFISTVEELKKDLQFHLTRKNDKELNAKVQYFFGLIMLVGLGVFAIGEMINYYSEKK